MVLSLFYLHFIFILSLFYLVNSNLFRFIISLLLYLFSIVLLNINYKMAILYLITAIGAVMTEHIFIKYIKLSWDYRNPDLYMGNSYYNSNQIINDI